MDEFVLQIKIQFRMELIMWICTWRIKISAISDITLIWRSLLYYGLHGAH